MNSIRILAVDDDALFLRVLKDLLEAADFTFESLREPTRVVPRAAAFQPHLILMDRHMPVLSGGEVVQSLQAFPDTSRIPVAFVLGDRSEPELIRALRAGAIDVMQKPVGEWLVARVRSILGELDAEHGDGLTFEDRLAHRLRALFRREQRTGILFVNAGTPFEGRAEFSDGEFELAEYGPLTGESALVEMLQVEDAVWRFETDPSRITRKTPVPGRLPALPVLGPFAPKVLLVDDDPELRRLFQAQVTRAGMVVDVAADGAEGVQKALAQHFDLILADLHMPRMDGWEMLRRLKADHHTREVPVVFLSALDDYRETLQAARAGAHDYLAKTGRAEPVLARLRAVLQPRLKALEALRHNRVTPVELGLVGPAWFLRTVEGLKLSGRLEVRDEWGRYGVQVRDGQLITARAAVEPRTLDGYGAIAALLVSKGAEGEFTPIQVDAADSFASPTSEVIRRTAESLNQTEARLTHNRLEHAAAFVVDEPLYALYRRVASERGLQIARATCEDRVRPADLPGRLGLPADEVREHLKDLLRRGVIHFAAQDA